MKTKERKSLLLFKNWYLFYMYKTNINTDNIFVEMEMRKCKIFSFQTIKVIIIHLYNKITKDYSSIGIV